MDPISRSVDQTSSQAKISLFRSLFRGRDDVYPRRFESRKTGRSGYAPACANEWVRGVCENPHRLRAREHRPRVLFQSLCLGNPSICCPPDAAGSPAFVFSCQIGCQANDRRVRAKAISVGQSPSGIGVTPDGATVYVTNLDGGTLSVIDAATNVVTKTVAVGIHPNGLAITADGVGMSPFRLAMTPTPPSFLPEHHAKPQR